MRTVLVFFFTVLLMSACKNSLSKKEVKHFEAQGNSISMSTYQKLSGTLKEKMVEGGIPNALKYCNTNAQELTEQMADLNHVSIKRTSLRLRNKNNAPDTDEKAILHRYIALSENDKELNPVVKMDSKGNPHYYAPILLEKKCLPCHGTLGKEVPSAVDSIIKTYYPEDQAIGFKENELRGIWSISFGNKK